MGGGLQRVDLGWGLAGVDGDDGQRVCQIPRV